jgi:signal transduction histidine kinase/AmiR/NasT family two-component response regulator
VVVPVVAGPMLVLTYLLLQGATPDAGLHERTLDAVRSVMLNDAALQRDALKARAGLLRNYDPLVRSVENLRDAAATLRTTGRTVEAGAHAEIERQIENINAAIADQEALVEAFKSRNALLQNSLTFFGHMVHQIAAGTEDRHGSLLPVIGALSNAMGRFTREPRPESATEITSLLDRLAQLSPGENLRQTVGPLIPHARLIIATLPEVDKLVLRLLAAPTSERARTFQDRYLSLYGHATARAKQFRILLYLASLTLAGYIGYLFLRLRANARILRARLVFENLISAISTRFINLPRDQLGRNISQALAQLARQANAERAAIILAADPAGMTNQYNWRRESIPAPPGHPEDLLSIMRAWSIEEFERERCVHVPQVRALPAGPEKAYLEGCGIRSWLCIPMWSGGKRVGFFTLDRILVEQCWAADDIALLRTAGEIFANAIERERTETEREALEARLQHGQRLEAVGTLAGGIAHEFNNILGAVLGYGELALAELAGQSRIGRYLRQIMVAGERATGVVDQILAFSRRTDREPRPLRIQPVIAEALDLLRASLPKTLALEARLAAGGAVIIGDQTRIQQVVMNLCTNGAQAMEGRGRLTIDLSPAEIASRRALTHGDLPSGRYVRLAVQDRGHGIDDATMRRIFEPFFTTKASGRGTGLGLSTVHGIVAQHGGALNVHSRPNVGSTFEVYFPRSEEAAISEERRQRAAFHGHGETILVVDDESSLVLLGEEMLAALRYEPVGFNSPGAALESFRRNAERFDLVLTDEVMPEMTGTELAEALHQLRPELPIILMTGYGGPVHMHRLKAAGVLEVLTKPLSSARLSECLSRHLSTLHRSRANEAAIDKT